MSVTQVGMSRKKVSFQFSFKTVQRKFRVAECIPGCGRSEVESTWTYRLGFRTGVWQRPFKCHRWSQMSVHRGGHAKIRQIVRSESMQTSVYQRTQFGSDAIWHLEPVQLPSHNVRNRCTIWELQNESGGGTKDRLDRSFLISYYS